MVQAASLFFACILFLLTLFPLKVLAHETKYAGDIGVLLHTEPDDSPITEEPAQLYFAFTDGDESFTLSSCNCTVRIEQDENLLETGALRQADASYGSNVGYFDFIFPTKGVYQVILIGSPLEPSSYHDFEIAYDLRVERDNPHTINESSQLGRIQLNINAIIYTCGILTAGGILIIGLHKPNPNKRSK